jgi:hypothetical protein
VLEYIWKAAWSLHAAGDPAAEDWVAAKALAILAGDSARAATEITAEAEAAGLTADQRNGADTCVRYLTSKHEFLRDDQALAAGWPIATGVIEGACRHLIGDRLDITGARWGLAGAEAILTLRAVISNGDFGGPSTCARNTSASTRSAIAAPSPSPHDQLTMKGPHRAGMTQTRGTARRRSRNSGRRTTAYRITGWPAATSGLSPLTVPVTGR